MTPRLVLHSACILLLCLFLLTCSASALVTSLSTDANGNYLISTADNLTYFSLSVNAGNTYTGKTVKLTSDINLANVPWKQIGTSDRPFKGTFDGQYHTISNLYVNQPASSNLGLFGVTSSAEIKNLNVTGTVVGIDRLGGITGLMQSGKITNCSSHVIVTGTGPSNNPAGKGIGGLVGTIESDCTITNCTATGNVQGFGTPNIGGLIGWMEKGTVTSSSASGVVIGSEIAQNANAISAGGLIGYIGEGIVTRSFATGTVLGTSNVGGLVGMTKSQISECYAIGTVTGVIDYVGGLVGYQPSGSIQNCYAVGDVTGRYEVGGLVGFSSGNLGFTYAIGSVTGVKDVGGIAGQENIRLQTSVALNRFILGDTGNTNRVVGKRGGAANSDLFAWNGILAKSLPFTDSTTVDNSGKDTSISQFWNNFTTTAGAGPWGGWNTTGIWELRASSPYRLPVFVWQTTPPTIDLSGFQETYIISASAGPGGSVSPGGTLTVRQGVDQTITVTANHGYRILNLTVDGIIVPEYADRASATYTFPRLDKSHVLIATFEKIPYTVTVTSGPGGRVSPSGSVTVLHGLSANFTFTPDIGYTLGTVTVNGTSQTPTGNNYILTSVTGDTTIAVTFDLKTYNITATAGANGSISPSGLISVIHGASQNITILSDRDYKIENITVNGQDIPLTNSTNLTIIGDNSSAVYQFSPLTDNATISVNFSNDPSNPGNTVTYYNITASAGANGTISPVGKVIVANGTSTTLRIDADTGYKIENVTVNHGNNPEPTVVNVDDITAFYTFTDIKDNATISVTFTPQPVPTHTLTANAGLGGSVSPSGTITLPQGSSQNITFTAETNYTIRNITLDGSVLIPGIDTNLTISSDNTTATYTFTNIIRNSVISADFILNSTPVSDYHIITASAGTNGIITPFGTVRVTPGSSLNVTILAASGSEISAVTVDEVVVTAGDSNYTRLPDNTTAWYNFTGISGDHSISATFTGATPPVSIYNLTATAGIGGTISPIGIFETSNTEIIFNISAYPGYEIDNLTVNGVDVGKYATYTLNLTENKTAHQNIHAAFSWVGFPSYAITATTTAGGTITPLGTITVATGYSQQFNMQADTGYTIGQVFIDGTPVPGYTGNTTASYTFPTVLSDHQIDVTYTLSSPPVTHQITVSSADANGTISPSGTLQVLNGSTHTFTIRANSGYRIDTLQNNETNITAASGPTEYQYTLVISSPITISVNFTALPPVTHTLNVTSGSNGSITPSGTISAVNGTTQSFLISADTGHVIENISVGETNITSAVNLTSYVYDHPVNADVTISAFFVQNASSPGSTHAPRNITVISGPGGTIDPSGNLTINATDTKPFNITANPGYVIDHVSVTGQPDDYSFSGLNTATYTLSNLGSDVSFTAFFRQDTLTLNVPPVSHGSISPSGTITTYPGAQLNFTITPDAGYEIDQFSYGGQSISPVNGNYTITAQSGSSLLVSFKPATTPISPAEIRTITISSGPHGLISPSGTFQITNGSSLNLTVQASPGFFISSVTANGVEIAAGPGSTQTFGTYNLIAVTKDTIIIASFTQQPAPPSPESGGGGDHGTTVYPITSTGTATTGAGTGITTVLLPAGIFGAVTITDLPSTIPAPPSGSYLTSVISVPSYTAGHAEIEFSVPVSILTDLGLTVHDVTFLTYDGTSWISHTTYYLGQTLGAANYVTAVTGFGPSAIGYKVGGAQIIIRATPEPLDTSRPAGTCTPRMTTTPSFVPTGSVYHTVAPDSTSTLQTAPAPFLGALAGLCAVVFLLRKRR